MLIFLTLVFIPYKVVLHLIQYYIIKLKYNLLIGIGIILPYNFHHAVLLILHYVDEQKYNI